MSSRNGRNPILACVLLTTAFLLPGCGASKHRSPPSQQVQDTVAAALPPFLSLQSIELESISTGPEAVKVNFKAAVAPKEDLYQVDREVAGTPRVILLRAVQQAGQKASLYGFTDARRMMDKWTLESPQVQGLEQFGQPRGSFGAQAYVAGSDDANTALRQQAVNAELQEKARKEALARQERERIAREEQQAREEEARQQREKEAKLALEKQRQEEEEQRKKDEQARRQPLIEATATGKRYIGTIETPIYRQTQQLRLVFTSQTGSLLKAELSNPGKSNQKETLSGKLDFDPKASYSILLSTGETSNELKLRLTDEGLEGRATMAWPSSGLIQMHNIKLQRE